MQTVLARLSQIARRLPLAILLLAFVLTGCASAPPNCHSPEVFCIGLVTGGGGLKDDGLNEQAWQALSALRSDGFVVDVIESVDAFDYEKNIAFFSENGYDMIITGGYSLAEATTAMARIYPQAAFVMIGQLPPADDAPPNLAGIVFPEKLAGFWAGALAAHFSETRSVGAVFAHRDIPTVAAYAQGFEAGLREAQPPDIQPQISFYPAGKFADSLNDREWGLEQAELLFEQSADVLFAYGGATALAALEQFPGLVIGVEIDLAQRYPSKQGQVIASIVFDFSILQEIARSGQIDQPVYEGGYRLLWGDNPAPEVLESLEYPEEAAPEPPDEAPALQDETNVTSCNTM